MKPIVELFYNIWRDGGNIDHNAAAILTAAQYQADQIERSTEQILVAINSMTEVMRGRM